MTTQENAIRRGECCLGIELGSTRIKAVLIDETHAPAAMGVYDWENRLENGVWTYHMEDVWQGIQDAFADLRANVKQQYGVELTRLAGIGVSAMMHGYLPFDAQGKLLTPFRTWRNTMTAKAAEDLTELFQFNVPQRWSIAHLYQAILNEEPHVKDVAFLTTLAGYVHWKLTGRKVLGVGDASGMFPIDSDKLDYDSRMADIFDEKVAPLHFGWKLREILPQVLNAGEEAGMLTEEGAKLLDPTGRAGSGSSALPAGRRRGHGHGRHQQRGRPYGQCVRWHVRIRHDRAGEASEQGLPGDRHGHDPLRQAGGHGSLQQLHQRHQRMGGYALWLCAARQGLKCKKGDVYTTLFNAAMKGEADCGGVLHYSYLSGEPITGHGGGPAHDGSSARTLLSALPTAPVRWCTALW